MEPQNMTEPAPEPTATELETIAALEAEIDAGYIQATGDAIDAAVVAGIIDHAADLNDLESAARAQVIAAGAAIVTNALLAEAVGGLAAAGSMFAGNGVRGFLDNVLGRD